MPPLSPAAVASTETVPNHNESDSTEHSGNVVDPCSPVHDDCKKEANKQTTTNKSADGTKEEEAPFEIVWRNVIFFAYLHPAALFGLYRMFTSAMWQTNVFAIIVYYASGVGVTAGAHRLWAHRAYKARLPLRIFLSIIYSIAYQKDIYDWARDHRVHHKFSETTADPHNATRGFFFSHMGWLLLRKHPEVVKKGNSIDLSDLMADPVVRFHRKYYVILGIGFCFVFPTVVPMYFWNESFLNSLLIPTLFRLCLMYHHVWLVNSAAHLWGNRPYDVHINPRENPLLILGAGGEGFHNYHHTFPYDYASSEYGIKYNITTAFIDLMALFGLAYDRKRAPKSSIEARKLRTGPESLKKSVANGNVSVKEE